MDNNLNKRTKLSDLLCMLPAFVFTLSILLVRLHLFSMPMTDIYWSEATDESTLSDLFNYWKAMAIIGAACLAVIVFVAAYFKDSVRFKKSFLYIPALIYATFVLLSFAFSDYKYFALRGMSEHFEGTIVLLAYIMIVFFLANMVDSERRLKLVVYCALGAALLLGILGITQATGHDFFSTAIGQKMMTPNYTLDTGIKSWDMIDILAASGQSAYDFSFTEGEVYQTVYNINYVPLYLTLLIPITSIVFVYLWMHDNRLKKSLSIIFLAIYALLIYNFFAANSASGYVGLLMLLVSLLVVFHRQLKTWFKPIICLIIVLGIMMGITIDRWLPEMNSAFELLSRRCIDHVYASDITGIQYEFNNPPGRTRAPIDYIDSCPGYMLFSIGGNSIKVTRDDEASAFIITDGMDNQLYLRQIADDDGYFEILDDRFHDYVKLTLMKSEEYSYIVFATIWDKWMFRYDGTTFLYENAVGKEVLLKPVKHSGLIDYEVGSFRGLIWATVIPMLSDYLICGSGADTFAYAYPQYDYATVYSVLGSRNLSVVTDKAHNLYMQYWVNTGFISLLAWLTMVGYYLVGAVKQFRKRGFVDFCDFVNGGIFCGICGFLAVAFFNDGSVNTMPMFYTMLGTGLAINMRDKWPSDEPTGETNGIDGMDSGEGKKKGKKAKAAAEVMPEM